MVSGLDRQNRSIIRSTADRPAANLAAVHRVAESGLDKLRRRAGHMSASIAYPAVVTDGEREHASGLTSLKKSDGAA